MEDPEVDGKVHVEAKQSRSEKHGSPWSDPLSHTPVGVVSVKSHEHDWLPKLQ